MKSILPKYITCIWMLIFLCIVSGCRQSGQDSFNKENHQLDSIISSCKDSVKLINVIYGFTKEGNTLGLSKAYLRLGILYRENGKFMNAIEQHRKGLEYAKAVRDTLLMVQNLNNIGTNFRRLGILDEASTYHYMALEYCEANSDTSYTARKNRVVSLNGIGNVQLTLGNDEEAERTFRLALEGEKSLKSDLGQAINYANIGSIYENRGLLDSARAYYQHSLLHNTKAGSKLGISLCYTHIGRLYERDEKWDSAIAEYNKAHNLMKNEADSWHWLESCIALSRANLYKGSLKQAGMYMDKALERADTLHSLEHLAAIYKLKYLLSERCGKSQSALKYYQKSQQYSDSIITEKSSNNIQNIRVRYERERRQHEINIIKREYDAERKSRIATTAIAIAVILISLLIIVTLWYIDKTRASKQKLMKQMENVRTQFFTNITHEFRTPLTVILGLSKDIADGSIKEESERKRVANIIFRQGNGLLELVNQLLDISKIKSQIGVPKWKYGNIVSYMNMMVESYLSFAEQKDIELNFYSEQAEIEMDFVPDYFNKIISNLISNALKFTPKNGIINVELKRKSDILQICISDTGLGIDADELPHIFEPFYTGTNSSLKTSTGVGLSLVHQLVQSINGEIKADSTLNKGTTFSILLPIKRSEGVKPFDAEIKPVERQELNEEVELENVKNKVSNLPIILIAEDNNDIAYYIGSQLKKQYQLIYVENGKQALEKALQIIPDIIITDLMMPEMDGITMIQNIRQNELVNHVPIIIISAKASDEDRINGISSGADAYLCKPFNSDELKVRVSKLLEQRRLLREKYSSSIALAEKNSESDNKTINDAFLNKCIDFVSISITNGEQVDIDSLALGMCVSSRQLNRKIQALTNDTPIILINRIKISKAKTILCKYPGLSMLEVATRCGFEDASYFGRVFKQIEGITPTQYRKCNN